MVDTRRPADGDETARLQQGSSFQLAPGTLLQGRYRIQNLLGKGGMGHVYLVRDEHFTGARSLRSMKEMIPRFDATQQEQHMINFKREADVLESLRHSNIPRVYDSFTEYNRAYLVLDYVEGHDLEHVIEKSQGQLSPEMVGDWMIQLCEIVQYLHGKNPPIIFRDLKPSNVILTPDGHIVLIDFGIAKVFQTDEAQTNVGTQGYAAPEQYERAAETRSDIYAIGAMMHHLLTKTDPRYQAPFSFHTRMPRALNPAVTPELETVIMRCLEHDKEKRYQDVYDLRQAIKQALGISSSTNTGHFRSVRTATDLIRGGWGDGPAPALAPNRSTRVRWRFATEEEVRATPLIAGNTLFIGSYDNNLYALNTQTGELRWKYATEGGVCVTPALWRNQVVFGSEDFNVYALEAATGRETWRYRTWHHVRSSPRVVEDRLYIGSDDGFLHAIDPRTGRSIWRFRAYREIRSTVAHANGILFFGSGDEYFYAVDALEGGRKWSYRTQGQIISSPTVSEGYVYFGSMDFAVYSLDAKSGWQAWREPTEKFIISSPAIAGDRLYIGSTDKHLYCLDRRTGHRLWKYPAGHQVNSTPVVANGAVYFGCIDGGVYCVDAASGKLRWRYQTAEMVCGSPVIHEGVVYIGSSDGNVYALDATP